MRKIARNCALLLQNENPTLTPTQAIDMTLTSYLPYFHFESRFRNSAFCRVLYSTYNCSVYARHSGNRRYLDIYPIHSPSRSPIATTN